MAVESKPLFHPEVIRQHLRHFELPATVELARPKLTQWAEKISSGAADKLNEKQLLPDFLTDIFVTLLGYSGPVSSGDTYTMSRENLVQVDGQWADAVLGHHGGEKPKFIVALEGKGTTDPLDRPHAGRKMSAVDQCYRYAINLPCDWILVTSMRETRLYHKGSNQQTYERFETVRLATDAGLLKRFVFLLGAARVVPESGGCHFKELLSKSETVGREITNKFYSFYAHLRQTAFDRLRAENPTILPQEILRCSQKLLDRILFCSFCEDRGLLPAETVRGAFDHSDPYNPKPIWDNFRGLFRSVDKGNSGLKIPAYNGGLFAHDEGLDALHVPDDVCALFRDLAGHDFRPARAVVDADETKEIHPVIDVDILGHIFEQSITDLERIRQDIESGELPATEKDAKTRRKKEGAFYTPAFITRYIVEQTLGSVLATRFETLRKSEEAAATATARKPLADPNVYDLTALNDPQRKVLIKFWEAWQEVLKSLRILDPACGSGAFLIEAFDQLHAYYDASNARLEELRGDRNLFDPDRQILQHNLYGVDLNAEAIQICQLSLWIKTAAYGKALTSLDHTIREGNSVVSDPAVHPKAFDWQGAFHEVFEQGGFDVVVGNPPYVRQELLTPYKPWMETNYQSFHGMADLYVYFYELGVQVLKPGGLMSYIVTNKWMKASYGEPLRRFFSEKSWIKSVVDFGHAKQIFEDADVFPCIIVAQKPTDAGRPKTVRLCTIPRDQLRIDDLSLQIEKEGREINTNAIGTGEWQLEPIEVTALLDRLSSVGATLSKYVGKRPFFGIKTGFGEAYLIDDFTRNELINEDPKCADLIRPYLSGQGIKRWSPKWDGLWLILLKSSGNHMWPWTGHSEEDAEAVFADSFPSIYRRMKSFEGKLKARSDRGKFWWELRSCAYYDVFEQEKLMWQDISYHPRFCLAPAGMFSETNCFVFASTDLWLLGVLNSPLIWWWLWRNTIHGKDEALRLKTIYTERIPIALPGEVTRVASEKIVSRLTEVAESHQKTHATILDWLRVEYAIEKPSNKLQNLTDLDSDGFIAEVKHIRGKKLPLTAAGLQALREEYTRTIDPARALAAEALMLERELNDLVNQAYGLTSEEIALMWATAPPRMPVTNP